MRRTSPARIGDIAGRGVEHGLIVRIEWRARQLSADDATTLLADQPIELRIKCESLALRKLT